MSDTITRTAIRPMPIVGAAYRPPAPAILASLPAGANLLLRPEPGNPFDPNAVMVCISTLMLREQADSETLRERLAGFGQDILDVIGESLDYEWHLGYIAKTFAAYLAPMMGGQVWPAELMFDAAGRPMAKPIGEDD